MADEESSKGGAERTSALDGEGTPSRSVLIGKTKHACVTLAICTAVASNTTPPLRTSTTASACVSRCGSTPIT